MEIPSRDELIGPRFSLTTLAPEHHRALYRLSVMDPDSFRWRYNGSVPPFDVFERSLHAGNVHCQFVVVPTNNPGTVVGQVVSYNASMQNHHAYLAMITGRTLAGAGSIEAGGLFLRYLFRYWPLRKVYLETPEFNVHQFRTAIDIGLLKEEGRLRGHTYFMHQYWDVIVHAIYREDLFRYIKGLRDSFLLPLEEERAASFGGIAHSQDSGLGITEQMEPGE